MYSEIIQQLQHFLKNQPQAPNSQRELLSWLFVELQSKQFNKHPFNYPNAVLETSEWQFDDHIRIDQSFPTNQRNEHITVTLTYKDILIEVLLLNEASAKRKVQSTLLAIEKLEKIAQRTYQKPKAILVLLTTDASLAQPDFYTERTQQFNGFSIQHGAYYTGNQTPHYHGTEILQLQSNFEFEWKHNRIAPFFFCIAPIEFPKEFSHSDRPNTQKLKLELPRGSYREILNHIAKSKLLNRSASIEELTKWFIDETQLRLQKALDGGEYKERSATEKQQMMDLAMNSFQGKGNSGACYAQIHIHTVNDKHRIHFGGMKKPSSDKNLFVILNPPEEGKSNYGGYRKLIVAAYSPEKHSDYPIYFGKKDALQKTFYKN